MRLTVVITQSRESTINDLKSRNYEIKSREYKIKVVITR